MAGQDLPTPKAHMHNSRGKCRAFYYIHHSWVARSRYVMEQHLGRQLQSAEHVHHRNGDTLDDRIENLEVLSAHDHHSRHQPGEGCVITKMVGKYGPYQYRVKKTNGKQVWTYLGRAHHLVTKIPSIYVDDLQASNAPDQGGL